MCYKSGECEHCDVWAGFGTVMSGLAVDMDVTALCSGYMRVKLTSLSIPNGPVHFLFLPEMSKGLQTISWITICILFIGIYFTLDTNLVTD